jgi:hypothetical protein
MVEGAVLHQQDDDIVNLTQIIRSGIGDNVHKTRAQSAAPAQSLAPAIPRLCLLRSRPGC